jgi:cytochrome P450
VERVEVAGDVVVLSEEFKRDAQERYARLREAGPVHRAVLSSGVEGWVVVGYEAAREALTHPALGKDSTAAQEALAAAGYEMHKPGVGLGGQMLEADPPEHTRLRRIVSGAFTPRRVAAMGPRIERLAHDLLDALPPAGRADLVDAFTAPLPVTVIADLLGVPHAFREEFRALSTRAFETADPSYKEAVAGLHRLLGAVVAGKRAEPGDDLLSALVTAHDEEDGRLSEDELVGTALLLVIAGHDTTVNLLGNSLVALLRHPEQLRRLRERPELLPGAVEEFLRYETSVELSTLRYASEDLVLAGTPIARGDVLVVALASASRDTPQADGVRPQELDVARASARHLSFGHGIHHCLGAPLARLEAVTALRVLLERFTLLEPAAPLDALPWVASGMMRGPRSLPVRYETAPAAPGA